MAFMKSHAVRQGRAGGLLLAAVILLAGCERSGPDARAYQPPTVARTEPAATAAPASGWQALANVSVPSVMLEGATVQLADGRYHDAERRLTVTLLQEPVAHGVIDGAPVTAALLAESGGGSGTFVSLLLAGYEGGHPVVLATTLLGDRPRVRALAIGSDGIVTAGMVQVGVNDRFCCPATPMRVDYAYATGRLITRTVRSATLNADGYADPVNAFILPATPYDRSEPPGGQGEPEHFAWTFGADVDLGFAQAQVPGHGYAAVYPLAPYKQIWAAAGDPFVADTLAALEQLLEAQPAEPPVPLPGLPLRNAVNDFAAQVAYLALPDGGRGVRYVGRYSQDAAPLLNSQLRYLFQGLSGDGEWLVIASLPIATSRLPDDNAVAVVDPAAPAQDIVAHLDEWRRRFNALAAADFEPALDVLDGLVRSVTVTTSVAPESGH
jgi:hypothetical protein